MGAAKLAFHVTVPDSKGEEHTFKPGDDLPKWAVKAISNPGAWVGGKHPHEDAGEPDTGDTGTGGEASYADLTKAQLKAEVDQRNEAREDDDQIVVGGKGNVPDLIAALEADDNQDDEDAGEPDTGDTGA